MCKYPVIDELDKFLSKPKKTKIILIQKPTMPVADPRGMLPAHAPLRTKIFLISCSFWGNPAHLYVCAPPVVGTPSYGESYIRPCMH